MAQRQGANQTAAGTLPVPVNSLVGRTKELAKVRRLLTGTRLLTLTGPGGVGKTRVALSAAATLREDFVDGVFFVSLASLRDSGLVRPAIADAVGARQSRLEDHLKPQELLLVLDNFEHVVDAGQQVAVLLAKCPVLKVLVTSREALRVYGECELVLQPLRSPSLEQQTAARLPSNDAARLFIERATASFSSFAVTDENASSIARICRQLDGLPLAIELAAARVRLFPPEALADRLDSRLPILTGGPRDHPERHRTLRNAFAWSHDLLTAEEQVLFRRLSVFSGGCTLEDAEAVCGPATNILDTMSALAAKSLVHAEPQATHEPRFAMLETVREYAAEQLACSGEASDLAERHGMHFLALAESAAPEVLGPLQRIWLDRLQLEHRNLTAALDWCIRAGDVERGARLAWSLRRFWWLRGHTAEGRAWLEPFIALARENGGVPLARALTTSALLGYAEGDHATYEAQAADSVPLWRQLEDEAGLAEALHVLGHAALDQRQEYDVAYKLFDESLEHFRAVGERWGVGWSLNCLATSERGRGHDEAAWHLYEEARELFTRLGDDDMLAHALGNLGPLAATRGEPGRGKTMLDQSVALFRALDDRLYLSQELNRRGDLALQEGDVDTAARAYRESLDIAAAIVSRARVVDALECFAMLAAALREPERSLTLAGAASGLRQAIGRPRRPYELAPLERALAAARASVGAPKSQQAWERGQRLTLEQAIELAISSAVQRAAARLTPRQAEVAELIALGLSNRQIAEKLVITEGTARIHVERILATLGFRSRAQVAAWAVKQPSSST